MRPIRVWPSAEAIAAIPLPLALRLKIIPLSRVGCVLTVVISDPLAITTVDQVRFHTGLHVEVVVAPVWEIEANIPRFYQCNEVVVEYTESAAVQFKSRTETFTQAALRAPHVRQNMSGNSVWTIEPVKEDWCTLCEEAMRNLEGRNG